MTGMYEWVDPWEAVEQSRRFERDWYDREGEHRSQMRGAALAFADAGHMMRAQMEAAWDPIIRAKALQPAPPIMVSAERFSELTQGILKR
jgi:hypothetical protein